MSTRILHVVANADHDGGAGPSSSAWLTDLAAAWHVLADAGCEQMLMSPAGGPVPTVDADEAASGWATDSVRAALLARTAAPSQIDAGDFDAVVCAASDDRAGTAHTSAGLQRIVRSVARHGGVVAALGHDPCAFADLALAAEPDVRVVAHRGTASETAEEVATHLAAS